MWSECCRSLTGCLYLLSTSHYLLAFLHVSLFTHTRASLLSASILTHHREHEKELADKFVAALDLAVADFAKGEEAEAALTAASPFSAMTANAASARAREPRA